MGFAASFLDDAYALKGEKILEPAADLLLSEQLGAGDTLCLAVEREDIVLRTEKRQV